MNDAASSTRLGKFVEDWHPARVSAGDTVSADRVRQLAATLNLDEQFHDGDALPLLWQWAFFLDWPRTDELGPDGHPLDGHFLPPIPDRRRMFAGGRTTVHAPLQVGRHVIRHSEITETTVKHGRTGELLFVTIRHTYCQDDALHVVEEQDLVYRSDAGASTPFTKDAAELVAPSAPWSVDPVTSPALLFRVSALTGNAHRIHYDEAYTTGTEGYPGLVVHGPLLAVYMAELIRSHLGENALRNFSFRLQRPAFVGDAIRVEGRPDATSIALAVVSSSPTPHATAVAVRA